MSTWPCGRAAEINPFSISKKNINIIYKYNILSLISSQFTRKYDLAAAATVVDIDRHQPKLILATRPRRHVFFLDKPEKILLLIAFQVVTVENI